jgi:hypothetical protein
MSKILTLTSRLKIFILLVFLYTVTFFYLLNGFIRSQLWAYIPPSVLAYILFMAITGFILGFKDKATGQKGRLDFLYHFYTFIVVNIVGIFLWVFIFHTVSIINYTFSVLTWGIGLLVHYFTSKKK